MPVLYNMVLKSYDQATPIGIKGAVAAANSTGTSHRGAVLGHIMAFAPSQDELEGKIKGIDEEMDLAAEFAPGPDLCTVLADVLLLLPACGRCCGKIREKECFLTCASIF